MSEFLAFDLGASSGRGIIGKFEKGKIKLSEIHRFQNGPVEKKGSLHWDIESLFGEIKTGLKKAVKAGHKISGIGIDTWGVDYVLFGKNGRPVRDPYHYRDSRTNKIPDEVFSIVKWEEIYRRTGIQFMQLNTIYQLYSHRKQHPEDFEGGTYLMMPDALAFMLCGKPGSEYTIASTSQLLDAKKAGWDFNLMKKLGIPTAVFPEIASPCTKAGNLKKELQKEMGCGPIPVFRIGGHDTASAVAAVPANPKTNWAYISCGTWALLGKELDKPLISDKSRKAEYTNEGGLDGKIRFLTNIMGLWLLQECSRIWKEKGKNYSYSEMAEMAEGATPMKYLVNPNNSKFFSPCNMPKIISDYCRETGQGAPKNDAEIIRCILDSLALCFSAKIEGLNSLMGKKCECLHIVGGGCQNKLLMQLSADATGIPVFAGPVEATALGNIVAQGIASGKIRSLAKGRELIKKSFPLDKYLPEKGMKILAGKAIGKFKKLP